MAPLQYSRVFWFVVAAVLLAAVLPYLNAAARSDQEMVFGGFLLNPVDGNSYLAKMYQGWRGDWQFTLPYTAEPGRGAYLFLFYLALGHLSRVLDAPFLTVFHAARLVSILLMLVALQRFLAAVLSIPRDRDTALVLAALGSGLGWLAVPFGGFTSDFWVAEAYPFLSAYANPHFPLGAALLLLILTPESQTGVSPSGTLRKRFSKQWFVLLAALALSAIAPFGVVIALLILGAVAAWTFLERRAGTGVTVDLEHFAWMRLTLTALGGLPLLAYTVWVTYSHPVLRVWNEQNQTPAPALWDLLVSFSPLLLLALAGGWQLIKRRPEHDASGWTSWRIPLSWAVLAIVLVYFPWNLQRRFLMGYMIPLAVLSPLAVAWLSRGRDSRYRAISALVIILCLPTNLLVLLTGSHAAQERDPAVYLYRSEMEAFSWLRSRASPGSLVLAAPQSGLLIPAYTGLGVLYGHPFETAGAEEQKMSVESFYAGGASTFDREAFLAERGIDFVFFGPRERALGNLPAVDGLSPVYQEGGVVIYEVPSASTAARGEAHGW